LDDRVDARFGRCAYFLLIDPESLEVEPLENPSASQPSGAGIQAAQFVVEQGVEFVLTGNCGPNAFRTLEAGGVQAVIGVGGTVREAVEQFSSGSVSGAAQANVPDHFGTQGGPQLAGAPAVGGSGQAFQGSVEPPGGVGFSAGMGAGRGMGRGRGGGMGGGRGGGMGGGRGGGMGGGRGGGMGGGRGGGMGGGRGGGMGRGMSSGMAGAWPTSQSPVGNVPTGAPPARDEVSMLQQQAADLENQLGAIQQRIQGLESGGSTLVALVDQDACTACGICAEVCPAGAIAVGNVANIDASACTGCARCVAECPQGAISLAKR